MPLYIKNSSSVIKYFHFYYNAQIYLYDNTSFDKRKHLFRNREQKIFVIFYPTAQKELLHISMRSPFLLRNEYSKWPILFYCVKRFLQIIENIVDIFCTDGKTDGVWLDSLLCLFLLI